MSNQTQTYGDLVATLTSEFDWSWNDEGSGASSDGTFWLAKSQGNKSLRPLGSLAVNHHNGINNEMAMLLLGDSFANRAKPPVANPIDYKPLWNDAGTGSKHDGSFWRPVAPPGFTACGDVCWPGRGKPPLDIIWCLRNDLTNDGGYKSAQTWDDTDSGASNDASFWDVIPTTQSSSSELIPTFAGTFRFSTNYSPPQTSLAKVPCLFVPKRDKPFPVYPPPVTAANLPEQNDSFSETITGTVTLPFTAFFDPNDRACLDNIANPFCTIHKKVSWIVLKRETNPTDKAVTKKQIVHVGVKDSVAKTMEHSVGVSISTEVGLLAKFSVTMNYQFSYSETKIQEETREKTIEEPIDIPPYSVTLLWGRRIELLGERADGTRIGGGMMYTANEVVPVPVSVPPRT
ncbi:hypothetical protein B0T16DRAFT_383021 [Cercophora newfieldiana]|uniref:Insecticidal crystal toxin domain-containing protein n=1 Tax=Cercophora newfieldiana TaxID=92897 RepID=A0AA40CHU5_9PEZI|nr:hypothetical protein B0T16DRAFT_383021 [Cercophora newfieldiana]